MMPLKAEFLKLKNSGMLWLATLGTVVTNVMLVVISIYLADHPPPLDGLTFEAIEDWNNWIRFHYDSTSTMLLPMFLVILCALSIAQEQRSDTWKQLYSIPVKSAVIYWNKQFTIVTLFACAHLIFVVLMIAGPYITARPFSDSPPLLLVINLYFVTVISSMGILGLVYLASFYSKSFIFPLALGIIGFVLAQLLNDYNINAWWLPFANPSVALDQLMDNDGIPYPPLLNSLAYFGCTSLVGTYYASKRRVRS